MYIFDILDGISYVALAKEDTLSSSAIWYFEDDDIFLNHPYKRN